MQCDGVQVYTSKYGGGPPTLLCRLGLLTVWCGWGGGHWVSVVSGGWDAAYKPWEWAQDGGYVILPEWLSCIHTLGVITWLLLPGGDTN